MEEQGLIESEWRVTDNNRKAKFYRLTRKGRAAADAELDSWLRLSKAVTRVLRGLEQGREMKLRPPALIRRLLSVVKWRAQDDEMDQEMAFHLDAITQEYVRAGMSEPTPQSRRESGSAMSSA